MKIEDEIETLILGVLYAMADSLESISDSVAIIADAVLDMHKDSEE